jgi:hypothetical protein
MKRFQINPFAKFCAAGAMLFAASSAFAIGPQYQIIPDAAGNPGGGAVTNTLNDVVSLCTPDGAEDGTGSVIGVTQPNAAGWSVLSILTANHVANGTGITLASFGQGPNVTAVPGSYALTIPLTGAIQNYTLPGAALPEDISVIQAQINVNGLAGAALKAWQNISTPAGFLLKPFPTAPPPVDDDNTNVSLNFTQYGYGAAATYDAKAVEYDYNTSAVDAARRFENNTTISVSPNMTVNAKYFEPFVEYNALAPSANGTGAGIQGDSGGPLLFGGADDPGSQYQVSVSPSYNNYANQPGLPAPAPPGNPIPITLNYTDYEAAVFTNNEPNMFDGATPPNPTGLAPGSEQDAVPLYTSAQLGLAGTPGQQGSYDWAYGFAQNPLSVPEPGTLSLIALSGFTLLRRRARK